MDEKCFAEHAVGCCSILTVKWCPGHDNCSFYKTEEQVENERRKNFARLSSLPFDRQEYIAGLYYSNKMPWHQVKK